MPDAPELAGGLPFDEAIQFLRQKVNLPSRAWTDLWEGMHARAFVVAGALRDELLTDLHGALVKAIREGTTLPQFRQAFEAIVAARGWTGWTGEGTKAGRAWRARVIWDTNLRMAYAAGRWQQIERTAAARPYLRYSAVQDARTRPEHAAWHGTILPADHEWWRTHFPPNGWYCRCQVIQLSARDLDRNGWRVSERAPASPLVTREIKGRGIVQTPKGIDPGFGHHVGHAAWGERLAEDVMAAWRAQGAKAWEVLTPGDWQSAGRPETVPTDPPIAALGPTAANVAEMQQAVRKALDGEQRIFVLPDGSRVLVDAGRFGAHVAPARAPFVPFLAELLQDPYEIWLAFERHKGTGRVTLRKRLIKVLDLPRLGGVILVAQAHKGALEAWTLVPSERARRVLRWRVGRLLWGR